MTGRWAAFAGMFAAGALASRHARADEKSPPAAAAPAGTSEPYWLFYAAFRNDAFTELDPPLDDVGFTHDDVVALRRQAGRTLLGGSFVQRIITSRRDRRRWDQVELFATVEQLLYAPERTTSPATMPANLPTLHVTGSLRAGPTLGGNWGGRYLQNGWHTISKTGPTIDEGLANDYPGDRTYGVVIGGRMAASIGDWLKGYGFVDGQLALGSTGVTSMQTALGVSATSRHLGAHLEGALSRYHVGDPNLGLPGGYGAGWQLEWRVGVDVHWSRFRVGYEYRANEGGSGEPLGVVEFSSTR